MSIPAKELKRRLAEFPAGPQSVAHCRSPYCVYDYQEVCILSTHGSDARRLVDGIRGLPARRSAGLAIRYAPQIGTAA